MKESKMRNVVKEAKGEWKNEKHEKKECFLNEVGDVLDVYHYRLILFPAEMKNASEPEYKCNCLIKKMYVILERLMVIIYVREQNGEKRT